MRTNWKPVLLILGALAVLPGCSTSEDASPRAVSVPSEPVTREDRRVERELETAREQIVSRADSVRDQLMQVRGLSRAERGDLRRDVNATQVALARSLGVRARSEEQVGELVDRGRLIPLEDSTQYWVVRELTHSVGYVTPDTRAMLLEIGERFHARLDSLGLPRFRMEVTSVTRTPRFQAQLRARNANAASGVSAHEFGTTVDVAHLRFAPPAADGLTVEMEAAPELTPPMRYVEGLVLGHVADKHAQALQAELGRVLREMRQERKLRVMMERRQAVYHMTVARRFPDAQSAARVVD